MNPLDKLKPSASMEVSRKAKLMKEEGKEVFSLSIGDNHFAPPVVIQDRIKKALTAQMTHYVSATGILELRQKIANHYNDVEEDEVLITPGLKQGLYYTFFALPFQKICVLEPAWLGYKAIAVLTNKEYISHNIKEADWLKKLAEVDFDALLICAPNNPDGTIFTSAQMDQLYKIVKAKKAYWLIDQIYKHFNFEEVPFDSNKYQQDENVFILDGFSKSHAMTGLRIAYILNKNKEFMSNCLKLQQNIATCANSIAQYAAVGFEEALPEVAKFAEYYKQNRDLVVEIIPEFAPYKPAGGFYYFVNLSSWGISDSNEFCKELLAKKGVALVPGQAYGEDFASWVRLSFSTERKQLQKALELFREFLFS